MTLLVTGCAGFIGSHLTKFLLERGENVVGVDNLSNYYDVSLKKSRLVRLTEYKNFKFELLDISEENSMKELFNKYTFRKVINLAAQAGVRYSLENPNSYTQTNLVGFANVLERCRRHHVEHLVYASSSSVYGTNTKYPFSESDNVDHPLSLYAATKKSNEVVAHSYAHLYSLPCTGLRFFTVYGPWGRPDMALFKFVKNILEDKPIEVYNHGNMERDFTYIDDIVSGIVVALDSTPQLDPMWDSVHPNPATSSAPYRVYNIGNGNPTKLTDFIDAIELHLGKTAKKEFLPLQAGDVPKTFADITLLRKLGYDPKTNVQIGVKNFIDWYLGYYSK